MSEKSLPTRIVDAIQPFVIGGASGCSATMVVQPVDMIKVRIQIKSEQLGKGANVSPFSIIREIYSTNGLKGFYKGLDSALARQVFYTTTRMGLYKQLFSTCKQRNGGKEPTLLQKSFCAMSAGFIGSLVGNPADLSLLRIQADTTLPLAERRGYTNVFNAFSTIINDEGVLALWRGCTPVVIRAVVLNLAMLAPYDEVKERLNNYTQTKDTQRTRLISSATAGFLAAFASLPFDNAKTKIQKMKAVDGVYPYKNIFDAMFKTASREGVQGLWVGFPTYYFRIAPHDYLTGQAKKIRN